MPNIDGVVITLVNFKKELEKRGHELFIFTAGDKKAKEQNKDKKVFYYTSIPFAPYPDYKLAIMPYISEREIRKNNMDIIHSFGMGTIGMAAVTCSKLTGLPLIGTMPTNIQEATHYISKNKRIQNLAKSIAWKYMKLYYNQCDKTLVLSEAVAKLCRENGIKNVEVTPWGVDLKRFRPGPERRRKNKNERINVLYLGRIVKEKNLDVVIKSSLMVAEKIKNVHFTIVGGGPAEDYYKKMVKEGGVEHLFTLVGRVKPEKTVDYYHDADIFVFPSIFETQGLAGLEAMACGLPVAGADYLAIPEFVKDGYNGYLFDPFDADDCANKIVDTIEERKKLRSGAIATARKYSVEKCTDIMLDAYYRVLEERKGKKGVREKIRSGLKEARQKILSVLNKIYIKRIQILKNFKKEI